MKKTKNLNDKRRLLYNLLILMYVLFIPINGAIFFMDKNPIIMYSLLFIDFGIIIASLLMRGKIYELNQTKGGSLT